MCIAAPGVLPLLGCDHAVDRLPLLYRLVVSSAEIRAIRKDSAMIPPDLPGAAPMPPRDAALRRAAQEIEAAFLAEMLKHAGLGEAREAFGGGAGETQFASLLRDEQASALAAQGGIGLAERLFEQLKGRGDGL
jgi:hypothetical protein